MSSRCNYVAILVLAVAAQYIFTVSPRTGGPLLEASDAVTSFLIDSQSKADAFIASFFGPLDDAPRSASHKSGDGQAHVEESGDMGDPKLAPQPDEVRRASFMPKETDRELRCGEKIPPESVVVTRGVEIFVKGSYEGGGGPNGEEHRWLYKVEFRNTGYDTVQMLTRHWLFVDAHGETKEVKGPGARGSTPVLAPGDTWSYTSATSLPTATGSMFGSFQFDTLRDMSGARPLAFSAVVGRLALSTGNRPELVPCGKEAHADLLPTTSVQATRRIIVGVTIHPAQSPDGQMSDFMYDVQINNVQDVPVEVAARRWVVVDAEGRTATEEHGTGMGGRAGSNTHVLQPGAAIRVQGVLSALTPTANAFGHYTVRPLSEGSTKESIEAVIGAVGLSLNGEAVADYRSKVDRGAAERHWPGFDS